MLIPLLAIVLGFLPGFAWLVFYLTEDPHPEPKRLVLFTFLAGIAFGFIAVVAERFWNSAAAGLGVETFSIVSLLGLALIEELAKFAAAHFSISRTPEMRDPIDPMIYAIVAALGFATLENIGTLANLAAAGSWTMAAFQTISLRFVGATLLHSLTSGIVGYQWSLGLAKRRTGNFLIAGLILATLAHAAFNYLILNAANLAYAVMFLLLVGFFVLNDFEKLREKEEILETRT
jgi:RsiW-degrading membrane proteinase PrsW (M82 family)